MSVSIEMDRDLPEGEYVAFDGAFLRHERRRIPQERIPEWAAAVHVSVEDYGRFLRYVSDVQNGR